MSIAQPNPKPIPVPVTEERPAGCTLSETIACWWRRRRELLDDLAAAKRSGSDDAEVLRSDLSAAESLVDALIEIGRVAT